MTREGEGPGAPVLSEAPDAYARLNRYSRIIVDEARRRGIHVDVIDPSLGELVMTYDGRQVRTLESLSELTSAVAFRRCDHKGYTRQVLQRAGLRVPPGRMATFDEADAEFLAEWTDIVVKPARGEAGHGISVGVVDRAGLDSALATAGAVCAEVVLEQRSPGDDLRIVVIDYEVVAASVRRPPTITGTGPDSVRRLLDELIRTRAVETAGASRLAIDAMTLDVVRAGGYELDDILPEGVVLPVRRTANLHTGGTIADVTDQLHPDLAAVARAAAHAIGIPVLGLDLMVPDVTQPEYVVIEANEQPGLANHEPQPTVERFVDLLFPETR